MSQAAKFAKGKNAFVECACGFKVAYNSVKKEKWSGHYRCQDCGPDPDPNKRHKKPVDGITLRRPLPAKDIQNMTIRGDRGSFIDIDTGERVPALNQSLFLQMANEQILDYTIAITPTGLELTLNVGTITTIEDEPGFGAGQFGQDEWGG